MQREPLALLWDISHAAEAEATSKAAATSPSLAVPSRATASAVHRYLRDLAERNLAPKRYVWKADGAEILAKIQRAREALAVVMNS